MTRFVVTDDGRRPIMLDAFCKAGGSGMGWWRAGFDVRGVDIEPQPHYPFDFEQADAVEFIARFGADFDAIGASPPCKLNTSLKSFSAAHHVELIPETRDALRVTGRPYIIENVVGADMPGAIMLCGSAFDLGVQRHRLFESNVALTSPGCDHEGQAARSPGYPTKRYHSGKPIITWSPVIGVYGRGQGLGAGEVAMWRQAMGGIDWMNRDELAQSIPPAYTEHLGRQLLTAMGYDVDELARPVAA